LPEETPAEREVVLPDFVPKKPKKRKRIYVKMPPPQRMFKDRMYGQGRGDEWKTTFNRLWKELGNPGLACWAAMREMGYVDSSGHPGWITTKCSRCGGIVGHRPGSWPQVLTEDRK